MAGDWIKVEKSTPGKPVIRHVARSCGCSLGDAFLAWFRLWSYFDETTADGFVPHFTTEDADEEARLPGIGEALSGEWLFFDPTGCTVHKWSDHNGESAKKRAQAMVRQRRSRAERDKSVTEASPEKSKRREEECTQ